jgi:hypothetical protein
MDHAPGIVGHVIGDAGGGVGVLVVYCYVIITVAKHF